MKNRAGWLALIVLAIASLLMIFVVMPRINQDAEPVAAAINAAGDAVKDAVPYPVSKNTSVWTQDETDILSQVWAGTLAPEAGMKQLAEKMQAALDAEQKK